MELNVVERESASPIRQPGGGGVFFLALASDRPQPNHRSIVLCFWPFFFFFSIVPSMLSSKSDLGFRIFYKKIL